MSDAKYLVLIQRDGCSYSIEHSCATSEEPISYQERGRQSRWLALRILTGKRCSDEPSLSGIGHRKKLALIDCNQVNSLVASSARLSLNHGGLKVPGAIAVLSRQIQARQEKEAIDEQRRQKHLPVARALRDPHQAPLIIAEASEQVRLWRQRQLCSPDYIETWEHLLKAPSQAAAVLEDVSSSNAVQLRQNSPFVAAVRRFKNQHAA